MATETLDQTDQRTAEVVQTAFAKTVLPLLEPLHDIVVQAAARNPEVRAQYESIQQRIFDNAPGVASSRRN